VNGRREQLQKRSAGMRTDRESSYKKRSAGMRTDGESSYKKRSAGMRTDGRYMVKVFVETEAPSIMQQFVHSHPCNSLLHY
jgi:hypothetical protein